MASLSHTSFATPNTQQYLSPLLSSHLSMDPASSSSSISTLSQPYSSAEISSWLQRPNAMLPYDQIHSMTSSLTHQHDIKSPLMYEGYSEAGDSIEHGFMGGDEPLLTSSWDVLDKLVSASTTSSGLRSGVGNDLPPFTQTNAPTSTLQTSSITAMEQKPLSVLNNSNGGLHSMWVRDQSSANNSNYAHTSSSNVGLHIASLISADPGFVERAAKYSSYSQQIKHAYTACLNSNMSNITNALSLEDFNVACARKLSSMKSAAKACRGDNAAMEIDANSDISAPKSSNMSTPTTLETKQSISPQGSMGASSGSKKKRETLATMDGEVEGGRTKVGRKKAKVGEKNIKDEEDTNNGKNANKVGKPIGGDQKTKIEQSNPTEAESEEKLAGGGVREIVNKPINGTGNNNGTSSTQAPKPDFIHVRARRGQATDSHSLAERVRREKISERMKYLQDLVPGCTKVTGKAMILDEIINYVQSLQRQVEFLSMKLAAVHPSKLEFNFESLFGKEVVHQSIVQNNQSVSYAAAENHADLKSYSLLHPNLQPQQSNHAIPESNISSCLRSFGSEDALRRTMSMLVTASSDTFEDQCISSQITDAWDEDLQNIVQLGFPQTPLNMNPSLHGALLYGQMKTEL